MQFTPQQNIANRRRIADALRNANQGPMTHPAQALAKAVTMALSGHQDYKANQMELDNTQLLQDEMSKLLAGPRQAQTVTPEQVAGFTGAGADDAGNLDPALSNQAEFWTNASENIAEEDANWVPQHPDIQQALLGQRFRMGQIDLQNQRFMGLGGSNNRQFAGDPIIDTKNGNVIVGYVQTNTAGAPKAYGLDGSILQMQPGYTVMPSASMVQYTPDALVEATPGMVDNTSAVEEAEQSAITEATGERGDIATQDALDVASNEAQLKDDIEQMNSAREGVNYALKDIRNLERALENSKDSPEGTAAELENFMKGLFVSIGFDIPDFTNAGVFNAAISDMQANYMQQLGARGLTDSDMKILQRTLPQLNQSQEAREQIIEVIMASKERTINNYLEREKQFLERPYGFQMMRPMGLDGYLERRDAAAAPATGSGGEVSSALEFVRSQRANQ